MSITRSKQASSRHAPRPPLPTDELVDAIGRLSLARSTAAIQSIVASSARALVRADGATLVLRDGDLCHYVDEDAIEPLWKGKRFSIDSCASGWVMRTGEPAVIENIAADYRIPYDLYRETFVRSLALVPIRAAAPLGAIGAYWARQYRPTREELRALQALADCTGVAIESVRAYEAVEEARLETLQRLALTAEYRDDASHQHAGRVAQASGMLARELGLPDAEVELIEQAAPLHDLGKITIPDALLLKPGRLTSGEYEQIKEHSIAGASILAGSKSAVLQLARDIALTHHEWWDGSGYPSGLRGEEIPLAGRIVGIVDVFDALTHDRPYKPPWAYAEALAEIHRLSGTQFDPRIVGAFMRVFG